MKGVKVYIEFDFALFRIYETKAFRDSYLAPPPETVAGIFGAMLGLPREELYPTLHPFYFGAKLLSYMGKVREVITLHQLKGSMYEASPVVGYLLAEPKYEIVLAGPEDQVKPIFNRLRKGVYYLPYGGSNEYLATDLKILGLYPVEYSDKVSSYAEKDIVKDVVLEDGGEISIAKIKMNGGREAKDFLFIYRGEAILEEKLPCIDGIALYPLERFYIVKR